MSIVALMPHARTALRHSLQVRPGEDLAILWDETMSPEFVQACRIAAAEVGAKATFVVYEPIAYRPLKEYCFFAGASLKPGGPQIPRVVAGAMEGASAIMLLVSDMEMMFSPLVPRLLGEGRRMLLVPYFDTPTVRRLLPTSAEEIDDQRRIVEEYGAYFEEGRTAHAWSKEGTDIRLRLGQWEVRRRRGIADAGEFTILPAGQVTRVPDDASAEGVIVIDRTIAANDYKELHEPIALYVKEGNVVRIDGGVEAKLLREFLSSLDDPRAYHVTELAIGTNPKCRFSGLGAPSEDTHKWGTVSFALGCDTHLGGGLPGPVHIDMTMRFPSLDIDDRAIVRDGRIVAVA